MASSFTGKRLQTTQQYVQETLRAGILQGKISAGSRLRQDEIAQSLGVSTTPVREALRTLASEGLISIDVHRGAVVRELTLDDVREIYDLRLKLEPILIERAFPKITESKLKEAREIYQSLCNTREIDEWTLLNYQFHNIFWHEELRSRLGQILENLQTAAMPYVALSLHCCNDHIPDSNDIHAEMLAAYSEKNLDESIRLCKKHLQDTLEIIEKSIK